MSKPAASSNISAMLQELDLIEKAGSLSVTGSSLLKKKASYTEPEGQTSTSSPTAKADDGVQDPTSGEEASTQKSHASAQSPLGPDAKGEVPRKEQEAAQMDLGVNQAGVGKDPAVEKDMKTNLPDPGIGTETSALSFSDTKMAAITMVKKADEIAATLTALIKSIQSQPEPKTATETAPAAAAPAAAAPAPANPASASSPASDKTAEATPTITDEQKLMKDGEKVAAFAAALVARGVKKADLTASYLREMQQEQAGKNNSTLPSKKATADESGGEPSGGEGEEEEPKASPESGSSSGGGSSEPSAPPAPGSGGSDAMAQIEQTLMEMGMTPEELLQLLRSVGASSNPAAMGEAAADPMAGGAPGGMPGGAPGGAAAATPEEQMMVQAKEAGDMAANIFFLSKHAAALAAKHKKNAPQYQPAKSAEEQSHRNEIRSFITEIRRRAR